MIVLLMYHRVLLRQAVPQKVLRWVVLQLVALQKVLQKVHQWADLHSRHLLLRVQKVLRWVLKVDQWVDLQSLRVVVIVLWVLRFHQMFLLRLHSLRLLLHQRCNLRWMLGLLLNLRLSLHQIFHSLRLRLRQR